MAAEPYVVSGTLTPKQRHNGKSRLSPEQFGNPLSQGTQWVEDDAPKITQCYLVCTRQWAAACRISTIETTRKGANQEQQAVRRISSM